MRLYSSVVDYSFRAVSSVAPCVCWDRGIISVAGKEMAVSEILNFNVLFVLLGPKLKFIVRPRMNLVLLLYLLLFQSFPIKNESMSNRTSP